MVSRFAGGCYEIRKSATRYTGIRCCTCGKVTFDISTMMIQYHLVQLHICYVIIGQWSRAILATRKGEITSPLSRDAGYDKAQASKGKSSSFDVKHQPCPTVAVSISCWRCMMPLSGMLLTNIICMKMLYVEFSSDQLGLIHYHARIPLTCNPLLLLSTLYFWHLFTDACIKLMVVNIGNKNFLYRARRLPIST